MLSEDSRGSITVEAALLMPVIMGIIFGFFYMIFYVHDRGALYAAADDVVMMRNLSREETVEYINGDLWIMNVVESDIKETTASYTLKVKTSVKPEGGILKMFLKPVLECSVKRKISLVPPEVSVEIRNKSEKEEEKGSEKDEYDDGEP